MSIFAVIGASRGIGLEYVRQLASRPDATVFAVVRRKASATHLVAASAGLKNVHIVEGDITDYASLERAAKEVAAISGGRVDVLIHNAARTDLSTLYLGYDHFKTMEALDADFIDAYKINALGVIHSITAFLPLLRASTASTKKIAVVNSGGADPKFTIAVGFGDMAAYCMTKAAALMATTKWAMKLKGENFAVISLSPGVVDTSETIGESGSPEARVGIEQAVEAFKAGGIEMELLGPKDSVSAQLKTIDALTPQRTGAFLTHTGEDWVL